jgi:lipopolysaccharide export system protein LptA
VFGNQQNEMRRSITYCLLFFIFGSFVCAQTKKNNTVVVKQEDKKTKIINVKSANSLSFDRSKSDAQILKGNVVCEHEGALLYCDSALLFSNKRMEAGGNIRIVKGDSITVTGNKLFYDASTKLATLEGNVVCVERDMTLTTNILTFDVANSIANYYNGGTIVNKENTLKSKNGHYYSASKDLAFHYDVVLTNPDYKMNSDTLRYNTINKTAYFLGPSIIISKDDYIYCENGYYDTQNERSAFSRNALLVTKQQKLRGDSLFYDRANQVGRAFKNIQLTDTSQKSILYGNYAEFKQKNSEALVTNKAIYARIVEQDTLFIYADTLYHKDIDSTNNLMNAYHHVRLYKKDLQAVCDSASYNSMDSLMQLFYNPLLWSHRSQASGKKIKIKINDKSIKGFILENNAFLINQVDSTDKFNQMSCKNIEAFFEKDTIRKAILSENIDILYYAKDKKKFIGLNKTTCSSMNIWFKNEEVDRATLINKPKGVLNPMKEVKAEDIQLKGFNWQYDKRPKSKEDLIISNAPLKK